MKINSEQEMMDFGHKFANELTSMGGRAWGTPTESSIASDVGENARTGPIETGKMRGQDPSEAIVIELIGDVGTGKTTFVRGLADGLGIKEPITSPSFTISKTYALPHGGNLIHYDFYRLSDPGLMAEDLAENLGGTKNIVVVEWGESIADLLPDNRTVIKIAYDEAGGRTVIIKNMI